MLPLSQHHPQWHGEITTKFPADRVQFNIPLKPFTSFRIGGNAEVLVMPSTIEEIQFLIDLALAYKVSYRILGHGSNLLIDDKGLPGITIQLGSSFADIHVTANTLVSQSGASLAAVSKFAAHAALGGLAPLCGIPGSLGGAVYMNAGAYGGEISDYLFHATVLSPSGTILSFSKKDLCFSYRHSLLQEESFVLLDAHFSLPSGDPRQLFDEMIEFNRRRNEKQPMSLPSAGSVFKRPSGHYASKLIDDCQLRGMQIGGAMVSPKHAGFIVNTGNATFDDVLSLIHYIQEKVFTAFQVVLEPEIRIWRTDDTTIIGGPL
ncbi:MAG: UDP-N-acetylmuramate dehydrogenase [Clostridiales bacterium]|nr:UDP-N-acetylmuramate dehydrogenase [Clostridiales bacterium]